MDSTPISSPTTAVSGEWYKASVWKRFVAVLIDGLILLPVNLIFGVIAYQNKEMANIQYLGTLITWAYSVYFISKDGATLGKKAMKIRVVKTDGSGLTLWEAVLREVIGKFISSLLLGIGYLWAIWDKNKQGLHDKIAGTYVVTKEK